MNVRIGKTVGIRVAGAASAILLFAACTGDGEPSVPTTPPSISTSPSTGDSSPNDAGTRNDRPVESDSPTSNDTTGSIPPGEELPRPRPTGKPLTVRGTVEAGVEAGCVILRGSGGQSYNLLGAGKAARPGATISAFGVLQTDAVTTCQQGTPFYVQELVYD